MDVLVVGAGAMGRWFAGVVDADVAFADRDPAVAEDAADAVGGRAVALDADEGFDAVCVAVPMPDAADAVAAHAGQARRAVMDVTGAMEPPLSAMAEHAPRLERVSLHPLFAPENAPGVVAVSYGASGPATDRVRRQLSAAGNEVVEVGAGEHDEAMRTVQGRAHAAVLAFALAAEDVPEGLSTPVYDRLAALVEQVTGGSPRVYADVQATFGGAADVARAAEAIADADADGFATLYADAGLDGVDAGRGDADGGVDEGDGQGGGDARLDDDAGE
jgi:prephenate dehydrogenase